MHANAARIDHKYDGMKEYIGLLIYFDTGPHLQTFTCPQNAQIGHIVRIRYSSPLLLSWVDPPDTERSPPGAAVEGRAEAVVAVTAAAAMVVVGVGAVGMGAVWVVWAW